MLIDATNRDQVKTRRVTFSNPHHDVEAESVYSNTDTDIAEIEKQFSVRSILRSRPFSAPLYRRRPVTKRKPRNVHSEIQKTGVKANGLLPLKLKKLSVVRKFPRSRSASESSVKSARSKKRESSRSSSRCSSRERTKRSRSRSSSQDSRLRTSSSEGKRYSYSSASSRSSSSSRSRSRSPKVKLDHQLKITNNVKIKEWLKEKNKEYRKMKKQERKEAKKKLKEKQEEEEKRQEKLEKSEIAVKQWIQAKKLEAKLIRKKNRKERSKSNQLFEGASSPDKPEHVPKTKEDGGGPCTKEKTKVRTMSAKPRLPSCKQPTPKTRARPKTAQANAKKMEKVEEENTNKEDEEKKKRISYDEWIASKRKQDEENIKKALKEKEEFRKSDPEMEKVISKIGQRIDKVKETKRRVDSDMKKIDNKSNEGLKEKNKEATETKENKRKHQLNPNESKKQKNCSKKVIQEARASIPPKIAASPPVKTRPVPPSIPKRGNTIRPKTEGQICAKIMG